MAKRGASDAAESADGWDFSVTISEIDGMSALRVHGEIDVATADTFRAYLEAAIDVTRDDFSSTSPMSRSWTPPASPNSSAPARRLPEGHVLALHHPTAAVLRVIETIQLDSLASISLDVEEDGVELRRDDDGP